LIAVGRPQIYIYRCDSVSISLFFHERRIEYRRTTNIYVETEIIVGELRKLTFSGGAEGVTWKSYFLKRAFSCKRARITDTNEVILALPELTIS
jgi:hypothetical protein